VFPLSVVADVRGGGGGLHADQQTTENIVEPGTILRMSFMGNPLHTDQYKVPIVRWLCVIIYLDSSIWKILNV